MADEGFKRKLAAILSADVIGYSRLMRDDEEATVRDIAAHRVLISEIIQQHHGRVIDSPGDNILAEFASVVDAVNGAIKIQQEINKRNADTPKDRRMEFRIGINLGDVIEEEERIYGDGVNIAARVEGLAAGGGIAISGTVYEHIKDKLSLGYHYLGEQTVKNIPEPVRIYRLLTEPGDAGKIIGEKKTKSRKFRYATIGTLSAVIVVIVAFVIWNNFSRVEIEPASVEKMAFPLPDKPSIAVLPFENLSGDPKQDYFSDGLTDQISSTLSKFRSLFVISSSSTSTYKGKPVKIQKVAEDLGVKYVLEGSVQRSGDRIRITAQLIDATTGHHIWSQRYDREQKDIFAIQDDITLEITKALQADVMSGEQARIWAKNSTTNLEAWEKFLQGDEYMFRFTKDDNATARRLFEEAIVLDPEYAFAYVMLGWTYYLDARFGWVDSRAKSFKMAGKYAQKGMELNDTLDNAYYLMGSVYFNQGQHEKAIAEVERAIALNPNGANNYNGLAGMVGLLGRWDESIQLAKKAIRLRPFASAIHYHTLGRAYFMTGQLDESITAVKKALDVNPNYLPALAFLAACYSSLDRHAEAAAAADEVRRINPKFNLESYAKTLPYKNKADKDRYIAALRKAGLPEHPPLPLPDKPSIAVLAFDNLSGDPEQEYFSDGIAENIITALSKVGELFVIARNSSFTYKGKPVKIQQVGRELGVRYVLEGSVQKSGDRVRITAQLIGAKSGQHLWAENYDRHLKDIFEIQDEITKKIVTSMRVKLTEGEQARVFEKQTKNLDVYLKLAQLLSLSRVGTKESIMRYGQIAKEIIDIEPDNPLGYRHMGWYHRHLAGFGVSPRENLGKALMLGNKALAMDESDGFAHALLGYIYLKMRKYEKAIESGKRSVELQPNGAMVHVLYGNTLNAASRADESIAYLKKAIRLNPFPAFYYYQHLGKAYSQKGQYEKALIEFKKMHRRAPKSPWPHFFLATAYSLLDRKEEAHASAEKCLELMPNISVSFISKTWAINNQDYRELVLDAMRKAGFPEGA
jgi:adenylate cyclase